VFAQSTGEAIVTSLLLFFIPFGALTDAVNAYGVDISNRTAFGFLVASILIVTVTLRVSISISRLNFFLRQLNGQTAEYNSLAVYVRQSVVAHSQTY